MSLRHAQKPRALSPGVRGISLLELLIAMTLGALLLAGLVAISSSAGAASALQSSQSAVQDRARFAAATLSRAVRAAGFRPQPWSEDYPLQALGDGSADDVAHGSDRLVLRTWSDRNCYGNLNPERDTAGRPRFFLRERTFDLGGSDNLTLLCRYGPSAGELATQIPRQGLVPGVESFQVLFGEDADRDGRVERWVPAGAGVGSEYVRGVRFGLLVRGEEDVQPRGRREFTVLDTSIRRGSDGRLRRVFDFAVAIRSRS